MITVKHRRADEESWLEADPVIPDGELALVRSSSGYDVKIGDGVSKYSELSPIMGKHTTDSSENASVTLSHRDHASFPAIASLTVRLEQTDRPDYVAMLSFEAPDYSPELTFEDCPDILFSGVNIEDNVFLPTEYMHYTLLFWRDHRLNCHVRGVYVG